VTRKRAKSADQTSFGTLVTLVTLVTPETPEALCSPPGASREPRRLAIVYAVPEFIWGMSVQMRTASFARKAPC
jgi:hypothetical protein